MNKVILSIFLVLISANALCQSGYLVAFGGDFDQTKTKVRAGKKIIQNKKISTDKSTALSPDFIFLDSTYFESNLNIKLNKAGKAITIKLSKVNKLKYIYIWYYKRNLTYEIKDALLNLQ